MSSIEVQDNPKDKSPKGINEMPDTIEEEKKESDQDSDKEEAQDTSLQQEKKRYINFFFLSNINRNYINISLYNSINLYEYDKQDFISYI